VNSQRPSQFNFLYLVLSIILLATLVIPGTTPSTASPALQQPGPPSVLPVFQVIPPPVNPDTAQTLASRFNNISISEVISQTTHAGTLSFNVIDMNNEILLEQYQARGGFYVANTTQAFQEIAADLRYSPNQICQYLLRNKLFPDDTLPAALQCDGQIEPPYTFQTIYAASVDDPMLQATDVITTFEVIGQVWQVPLAINVGPDTGLPQDIFIPIGGPGGHLSLLVTGYDDRTPIDSGLPGLQALAIPTHGVSREVFDLYEVVPVSQAVFETTSSLSAMMPGAVLDLGDPELIYFMDDPAVEQDFSIPVYYFPEATAIVDGEEVNLRGMFIPAISGFLPEVVITSPDDGMVYLPGSQIDITAVITEGEPPYSYTLELEDGTPVASGVSADGQVALTTDPLPVGAKPEEGLFLTLVATDSNGASGSDVLVLQPPARLFAPVILKPDEGEMLSLSYYLPAVQPDAPQAIRSMGAEWVRYYNGHGSNLPGTQPDGTGFYNKMAAFGWQGKFHWYNNNAWEKDWRDCSLGGIDCSYGVDRVDFAYFAGHGSPAKIYFGVNKDSYNAQAQNARFQNLRWAGFATCQTLRAGPYVSMGNPPLTHWIPSFKGSYMLLGFHSNMADVAFGPKLVDNMKPVSFFGFTFQRSIREAWVYTAFQMNAGKPAYMYARTASFNPVNRVLPNAVSPDPPPLNPAQIVEYRWAWWD
jgi:hypothetical protein